MAEIIKIEKTNFNNKLINTVNARDLHEKLGSKQDFSTWIKNRIEKYEFVENLDFIAPQNYGGEKSTYTGTNNKKEYYISIDMAKELCMVENNEQGKKIRKYFIQCEEELKQQLAPTNLKDALLLAYNQQCKIEEQEKVIQDKNKTIQLISTNTQEKTYKKELRANIVNLIRKINKQTGAPFSILYEELYKRFINNHHFEWKLDFYKSKNKLDYISNKDIEYLKELKDITITMLKQ